MNRKLYEAIDGLKAAVVKLETKLEILVVDYSKRIDRLESGFIWIGGTLAFLVLSGVMVFFFFKG